MNVLSYILIGLFSSIISQIGNSNFLALICIIACFIFCIYLVNKE
jgi:hypothetical protein